LILTINMVKGFFDLRAKKYSVWIEAEHWAPGAWNIFNDNTDVIVDFEDGSRWLASFFTYSNIETLSRKNASTGEYMNGKFFWSSDMVLIDEVSRIRIEQVIEYLICNEEFEQVFTHAGRTEEFE
jgi:hypothetical protein